MTEEVRVASAKPRLFIGSSVENLEVAYAAQENLEHDAEVTVWNQGIFELSRTTMETLLDVLDEVDFGLFVLSPDDITQIRDTTKRTVRDNVIFELGLFIGHLGRERAFMLVPRGSEENHLPTDLLGLTPASYEPDRQDRNAVAAVGPGCNRVRKAMANLGPRAATASESPSQQSEAIPTGVEGRADILALIEGWMGARNSAQNRSAIRYADVDRELGLKEGSAKEFIAEAAKRYNYRPRHTGEQVITFEDKPRPNRPNRLDF